MSAAFSRRLRTRKLKSEINVVPYIDVMLVLLIIFMVTAPLLNLGVDVDLPDSKARAVQSKKDPVLVSVDAERQQEGAQVAGRLHRLIGPRGACSAG